MEDVLVKCFLVATLAVSCCSSFPVFYRLYQQQQSLQGADVVVSLNTDNLSEKCARHVNAYMENLLTAEWALSLLDSTTKIPEGLLTGSNKDLGNFDECVRVRDVQVDDDHFNGKYCLVSVYPYSGKEITRGVENYRSLRERAAMTMMAKNPLSGADMGSLLSGQSITGAICLPSTCTTEDFQQLLLDNWPVDLLGPADILAEDKFCQTGDKIQFRPIDWFAIAFLIFFALVVILSTAYDLLKAESEAKDDLLVAFSVYTNGKRLLSTKKSPGALHCLHGIRFLSITWVIIGHRYTLVDELPGTNNLYFFPEIVGNVAYLFIFNGVVSVDTFFILGGILCSYIFLGEMKKGKKFNLLKFYLHRYIRLTPVLAVVVLLFVSLMNYTGDGPFWKERSFVKFRGYCDEHWWSTLLYVGNYVNPVKQCVEQSWYVACDMQMYWFSPLILVPLWRFPKLGRVLLGVFMVVGVVIDFVMSYCFKLVVSFVTAWTIEASDDYSKYYYYTSHSRYPTWLSGIILGYVLFEIKQRKIKVRLSKLWVCCIWSLSGVCMAVSFWSLFPFIQLDYEFNNLDASFFNALHRPLWALGVCLMIFACCVGYGGPLDTFFSWSIFIPLSRLTYSIYLTHMAIQFITGYPVRAPTYKSDAFALPQCYADVVIAVLVSSVMYLVFEAPFLVIERKLLGGSRRPKPTKAVENVEAGSKIGEDIPVNGENGDNGTMSKSQ